MNAVPKPPKETKKSASKPQITEDKYLEISDRLAESYDYGQEITITVYRNKMHEKYTGIVRGLNANTRKIAFDAAGELDQLKIDASIIVDAE
ncbi:YolD-like family protein [Ralstonia pickettii]|nr:YolD-like family protein [Ralstonia pickettii]